MQLASESRTEIRGIWIANYPHSQVLESPENIFAAMEFLAREGFNFVFPVVWNRGYTLFPSQVMSEHNFPILDPVYQRQQRDPLAEIIIAAARYNIAVIPWLEYGFAASHLLSGGHILHQQPHWRAITPDGGTVRHGNLTWMNGLHPEVQQFMLQLVLEVLERYDVAGIQGCDRFPALPVAAGYDRETAERYHHETGKSPPSNPKQQQWLQWRANLLTDFLAKLYLQVKQTKPQAIVSLAPAVYPFCWQNLLQDSQTWLEKGIVDLIHPQIYRSSYHSYYREVKKIIKAVDPDLLTKFAPGIAFTANGKELNRSDLGRCIRLNRHNNFSGTIFFHYQGLLKYKNLFG
ncbi:glycoside hydrolase family 10 protein [Myxosarcina sp. GI1(2024)]